MKTMICSLTRILAVPLLCFAAAAADDPGNQTHWWSDAVDKSLEQGGTNRPALQRTLDQTPIAQRPAMQFLLENMPACDLQSLSAEFLLENTDLAMAAFANAPWHDQIPPEIFLNDVLPY